ncbi:PPIC-type PPIASE domain protein [Coleofasciculus chthonoplastes PCC 7420]|jgi:parvulin-like peptidyl-prolyl isomerase|uniref:peptidylprolyl isomerase n=1 Tax=Coleofasciculus chthonoplastes PCC 7420 TaxID=118168 RepID=B4VP46_9CYAN|nr:peptidylprolyl isomerase [Coleofasciculus chthonoplastes]EDX76591.1 PPIC-type PPIASE domain protein [Coleofasciculus chthonoplastes PCC 7420]
MVDTGASVESEEIVEFLKQDIQYKKVCHQIWSQRVIERATQERGIVVTPEEIQAEADKQRQAMHLEKAADTLAWLADQRITPDDWEAGIRLRLLTQKLADCLFGNEVEKFFTQNRLDYEQILLYQLILASEPLARELFYEIEEGEISFYEAAHLYDIDPERKRRCGYEGKVYRWRLKPEMASAVFAAPIGEVVGPIKTDLGYHLLRAEEFIPAQLTPERSQEILNRLFGQWLESEVNYLIHSESS